MSSGQEVVRQAIGAVAVCVLALPLWGCGDFPEDKDVQAAFLKEYPQAVVTAIRSAYPNAPAGQVGGDIVYKHIRFRPSAGTVECEVLWRYSDGVPEWTLYDKSAPALPGTLCEGCTAKSCPAS